MKTVGIVVVLLGVLGVAWLLVRDVESVTAGGDGKAVVEPLQRAKDAADSANQVQKAMQDRLNELDK